MVLLGIDYGLRKIGLALAGGRLAEPYKVIRYKAEEEAIGQIVKIAALEKVDKIIVGISEGKSADEAKAFGVKLSGAVEVPVGYADETLSTQTAQSLSIEAGIGRAKRKSLEDAFAAAVMLQLFVDENV
jgi:putative Holliday junction resolvase